MLPVHPRPPAHKRVHLLARELYGLHRRERAQVLPHEEEHPGLVHVAHNVRGRRVLQPVAPRELKVRDQQRVAAPFAEAGLKRHEHAVRLAAACDAFAEEKFNPSDHTAAEAHVRREGPLGEAGAQGPPQGVVVPVAQPHGAVGGLEFDKRNERGRVGGAG